MERPIWQKILYNIWPSIHRTVANVLFFIVRIIKAGVRVGLRQIGM